MMSIAMAAESTLAARCHRRRRQSPRRSGNHPLLFSCRARRTLRRSRARCRAEIADRDRPVRERLDRSQRRSTRRSRHRGARARTASPSKATRRSRTPTFPPRSSPSRAVRCSAPRCSRTSTASSRPTGAPDATRSASNPRSSTTAMAASTSSIRSRRARRRRCARSNSPAIGLSASASSTPSSRPRRTTMLSFLTGGDVYDPDRIAQDRELLRTLLSQQGLCRRQRDVGQGRVRSGAKGVCGDLRDRRRSSSTSSATSTSPATFRASIAASCHGFP